ncbi:hypothetical protein IGI04_019646 [Brassica rapa subsp. trilocularis]|uniref:MADS-box domain-containing protein n=1 Tax=Brassica rapa subsp. trilocularis TaxID=1813537 RepID=A0ABQ7MGF2_BRACM|nr:hypothetical protein IGI04_019646 [Brassica rapa subsp. trilocularis]
MKRKRTYVGNVEEVKTKIKSINSSKLQIILHATKRSCKKNIFIYTLKKMDAVVICVLRFMSVKSYKKL